MGSNVAMFVRDVGVTVEDGIEDLKPEDLKPDIVQLIRLRERRLVMLVLPADDENERCAHGGL